MVVIIIASNHQTFEADIDCRTNLYTVRLTKLSTASTISEAKTTVVSGLADA